MFHDKIRVGSRLGRVHTPRVMVFPRSSLRAFLNQRRAPFFKRGIVVSRKYAQITQTLHSDCVLLPRPQPLIQPGQYLFCPLFRLGFLVIIYFFHQFSNPSSPLVRELVCHFFDCLLERLLRGAVIVEL